MKCSKQANPDRKEISSFQGREEWEVTINVYEVSSGSDKILEFDSSDGCTTLNILKTSELYFMVYELYLTKAVTLIFT